MATKTSLADYGLTVGDLPSGALGAITDVPGVTVGHVTIDTETHKTGVTVLMPCADNPFVQKPVAASYVLNGFGKTQGLVQIDELGTLETPIALTNTLNVGLVHDALVEYCVQQNPTLRSVNPIVAECNDSSLNDIRNRAVTKEHVLAALANAGKTVQEGDVGAGKGMVCHGFKGGIGTASRLITVAENTYTLGVLALTNHGRMEDFVLDGVPVGAKAAEALRQNAAESIDKGSCILIMATDLPLSARQIKRVLCRGSAGLARLGSHIGHGSGEVFIGFTTANRMPHNGETPLVPQTVLAESLMDLPFRAMVQATEEAVLRSMLCADTVTGFGGETRHALRGFLKPVQ